MNMPNQLELFEKEEYIIPSGEYFAQQFSIEKDADLEISGKLIDGQGTNISIMSEGDWEWMMQNGSDYDIIKTLSIDASENLMEKLRLSSGEYILHLEPTTSSGTPSRISLDAEVNIKTLFTLNNILIFLVLVTAAVASLLAPAAGLIVLIAAAWFYLVFRVTKVIMNKIF